MKRCSWCSDDKIYQKYHDCEWGVPVYDDYKLFEFLILEGAQAGLSWITILRKRENYRRAFDGFDFERVARYTEKDVERLMTPLDTKDQTGQGSIVRNRLKIKSAVSNANAFIEVRKEFGSFSNYLWGFVDGIPVVGDGKKDSSKLSDEISRDLKRRGFSFVGTKIVYAFLQAVGVVNDHEVECFRRKILDFVFLRHS
jgi:DNA-3-methyladenine glycosylase I